MVAAFAYGPVAAAAGIAVRAVAASGTASIARAAPAPRRRRGAGPVPGVPGAVPPRAGNPVMAACFAGGGVADAAVSLLVISGVLRDGCGERSPGMRGGPRPAPPVRRERPGAGCPAGPSGSRPTCSPPATGHKGGTPHLSPTVFPHRRRRWATRRGPRGGPSGEHSRSTHSTTIPPAVEDIVGSKPGQ